MSPEHRAIIAELSKNKPRQRYILKAPVVAQTIETYTKTLLGRDERLRLQSQVNGTPIKIAELENIELTTPYLLEGQHEDVLKAEKRLWVDNENGFLITNSCGTGKTFSCGGVMLRALKRGLRNHLVVTPSDKICKGWISEMACLNIHMYQLEGVNDNGERYNVVTTTYANFRQNERLIRRIFDLIIYDESQHILGNKEGDPTNSLITHRKITRYKEENHTKVIFSSATPFPYHTSIEYVDGFVVDMGEDKDYGNGEPSGRDLFYMENFGYRFENGRLMLPENGVDVDALERVFTDKLLESGAMSTKTLNIPFDYSREFVLIKDNLGAMIDEGYGIMVDRSKFKYLFEVAATKFSYLNTIQLLECIKARANIERIKQHLALGRKVVIFHTYNNSKPEHPFHIKESDYIKSPNAAQIKRELNLFNQQYPQFAELDLHGLKNVRETLKNEFGYKVAFFNGEVTKHERNIYLDRFNTDHSGKDILCIQREAGGTGISAHDKTGVNQRAMQDIGLPVKPTQAAQDEGRIIREGSKSDGVLEYLVLHLNFEKMAFANKISARVKTVENLAVGSQARNLETSFKEGYLSPTSDPPSLSQGKGGKEADNALQTILSDYELSLKYYEATKKRGLISLPEPIGYAMCRFLDYKPNNNILNPMALWGNIGRFLSPTTINDYTELNLNYRSMLNINVQRHHRIMNIEFDELDVKNKYNGIVFYCPKHEHEKMASAYARLRNTGRIVMAINKRSEKLEAWVSKFNGAVMRAIITIPDYTIYVVDKLIDDNKGMKYGEANKYLVTQVIEVSDLKDVEIDGRFKHIDEK